MLRATVHSTKCHAQEICNTMNLFKNATHYLLSDGFHIELKVLLDRIQSTKRGLNSVGCVIYDQDKQIKLKWNQTVDEKVFESIKNLFQFRSVKLFQVMFIGGTRFATRDCCNGKTHDDSCILYRMNSRAHVGFIEHILMVGQKIYLKIACVEIKGMLNNHQKQKSFHCKNLMLGNINEQNSSILVPLSDLIEKLVFFKDSKKSFTFFRFPTLSESS